jgi:hypothetical protein
LFDNITWVYWNEFAEFHYTITGYDKAPSTVQKAKIISS